MSQNIPTVSIHNLKRSNRVEQKYSLPAVLPDGTTFTLNIHLPPIPLTKITIYSNTGNKEVYVTKGELYPIAILKPVETNDRGIKTGLFLYMYKNKIYSKIKPISCIARDPRLMNFSHIRKSNSAATYFSVSLSRDEINEIDCALTNDVFIGKVKTLTTNQAIHILQVYKVINQ